MYEITIKLANARLRGFVKKKRNTDLIRCSHARLYHNSITCHMNRMQRDIRRITFRRYCLLEQDWGGILYLPTKISSPAARCTYFCRSSYRCAGSHRRRWSTKRSSYHGQTPRPRPETYASRRACSRHRSLYLVHDNSSSASASILTSFFREHTRCVRDGLVVEKNINMYFKLACPTGRRKERVKT